MSKNEKRMTGSQSEQTEKGYTDNRHDLSAKHLQELRKNAHLTLKELEKELTRCFTDSNKTAERTDVVKPFITSRTLQAYEATIYSTQFDKNKNISAINIVALADYYHVSADYILGMSDYSTPDIELAELGKEIGFSDTALKSLEKIIQNGYLPTLNTLLEDMFLLDLLGDIKRTCEYTDKVKELKGSITPDILRDFQLYVNIFSEYETEKVDWKAELYLEKRPTFKPFFQAFSVFAHALCGIDYIEYMRQKCVERFSKIFARITDFDKAKKILEKGTDDDYKIALDKIQEIETSGEE